MGAKPYKEQWKELRISCLKEQRRRGDVVAVFGLRGIKQRNRLPPEVREAPSPEGSRKDWALSRMV